MCLFVASTRFSEEATLFEFCVVTDFIDLFAFCVSGPINGEVATVGNGSTIGFKCKSPEQLREFHDTAVAHGGTSIEEAPGLRNGTLGAMYLAYVRDPDGNQLCAVFRAK